MPFSVGHHRIARRVRLAGHANPRADGRCPDRPYHALADHGAPLAHFLAGTDNVGAVTDSDGRSDDRRAANRTPTPHHNGTSLGDTDATAANA